MSRQVATEQSGPLPKASYVTAASFSKWVPESVGHVAMMAWHDSSGKGRYVFVSADGTVKLPFVLTGNNKLKEGCDLVRYLRRHGLIRPAPEPDVHSVEWLADQAELATAEGRSKAIDLIKQVPTELARLNSAGKPADVPAATALDRLRREPNRRN
jgi:hypothetical protein